MASKNKPTGLRKLFEDLLADIYYAEKKIASALKTMTKEAQDGKLSKAFESHHKETQVPVSYTHLRAHETVLDLVCRLLLEKKKKTKTHDSIMMRNSRESDYR